jgi:hypothetical protein
MSSPIPGSPAVRHRRGREDRPNPGRQSAACSPPCRFHGEAFPTADEGGGSRYVRATFMTPPLNSTSLWMTFYKKTRKFRRNRATLPGGLTQSAGVRRARHPNTSLNGYGRSGLSRTRCPGGIARLSRTAISPGSRRAMHFHQEIRGTPGFPDPCPAPQWRARPGSWRRTRRPSEAVKSARIGNERCRPQVKPWLPHAEAIDANLVLIPAVIIVCAALEQTE